MTVRSPFKPHYGSNQVITPGAASAVANINGTDKTVRVSNTGAAIGYFRTYSSTEAPVPTASTADMPVAAGETAYIEKAEGHDRLAHISAAGTTFQVMTGEGGF
jgi:hypothetical protein